MKTIVEHIEYAKGQPHHIRKRITFAAAGLGTGLVALVWLVGSLSSGTFAIQGSNFSDNGTQEPVVKAGSDTTGKVGSGVAGAASALSDPDAPARIEIVDTLPASQGEQAEPTIIPF